MDSAVEKCPVFNELTPFVRSVFPSGEGIFSIFSGDTPFSPATGRSSATSNTPVNIRGEADLAGLERRPEYEEIDRCEGSILLTDFQEK